MQHDRGTRHKKHYFWELKVVMVSYLGDNDTLLQNVADVITKYNSCFNTKCGKSLLQNVLKFYYKM